MTKKQRDNSRFTDFSKWLNMNAQLDSQKNKLDIQDLDYIIHQYDNPVKSALYTVEDEIIKVLILEEKCFMTKQTFTQKDTHGIIDQALHFMSGNIVKTYRGKKYLQYYGYYLVLFENTSPSNGKIFVNYKEISRNKFIKFLKFGLPESFYKCYLCNKR